MKIKKRHISSIALLGIMLLAYFGAINYCWALDAVTLSIDTKYIDLNSHEELLLDTTGSLSIDDIISRTADPHAAPIPWVINSGTDPNFGFTQSPLWLHMRLHNPSDAIQLRILSISYPILDMIDIYLFDANQLQQHWLHGDKIPFQLRKIDNRSFLTEIEFKPNSTADIYIRVQTSSALQVPLELWDVHEFYRQDQLTILLFGLNFGALAILAIYNLFLYFATRSTSYLFYVLYVVSFTMIFFCIRGFGFQYFWPNIPRLNDLVFLSASFFCTLQVVLFSKVFLETKLYTPKTDRLLSIMCIALIFGFVLSFFLPYSVLIKMAPPSISIATILVFQAALFSLKAGNQNAKVFLLAWSCLLASIVLWSLNKAGLTPRNAFTEHGIQIGSLIEITLLSLALADRVRRERNEKLQAQQIALVNERVAREEHERHMETRLKAHQDEMLAKKVVLQAQAENKAKSQFFALMNHELRTPLTSILGYTDTALCADIKEADKTLALQTVKRGAQQLLQLVNDILDISKIETQKLEIEIIDTSLNLLFNDVKDNLDILANRKGIALRITTLGSIPAKVQTDPTRLKQVLINLGGNAIKFTEKGSVEFQVSYDKKSGELKVAIKDTGLGLKPEQKEKLFGLFSQADASTSRNFGGSGLGLHLSKQIIEKLNGEIIVDSIYGEGSTFTVSIKAEYKCDTPFIGQLSASESDTIECSNTRANTRANTQANTLHSVSNDLALTSDASDSYNTVNSYTTVGLPRPLNILLAEDHLDNQKLIQLLLTRAGATVVCVQDGIEALAKALTEEFDLILMDMQMPKMDGITAVKCLRSKGMGKPIYALTADDSQAAIDTCMRSGCDGHLTKPVDLAKINDVLRGIQ